MDKAVEAAIQAGFDYWSDNAPSEPGDAKKVEYFAMQAAIDAYLAASGDAEAAAVRRWESSLSPLGRCESSNESDWQCLRQVGHCGEHVYAGDIERALDRADKAEAECLEQARLNGRGSEREAALLANVAAEKAAREKAEQEVERLRTVLIAVDEWDLNWADGLDSNVERIKTLVRAALEG